MPFHTRHEREKRKKQIKEAVGKVKAALGKREPKRGLQTEVRRRQQQKRGTMTAIERELERQRGTNRVGRKK